MCHITLLHDAPPDRALLARLLLAHGAGAGMQTEFMSQMAALLSVRGIAVTRFEFAYMAQRRIDGKRRPPPRADLLREDYLAAVRLWRSDHPAATVPMLIGGKSLGGRVATLVAGELRREAKITGIICLGYPFHPPKKPHSTRTAHLVDLAVPTLVIQGERDPFGTRDEVAGLRSFPRHPDRLGERWRSRPEAARRQRHHTPCQSRDRSRCHRGVRSAPDGPRHAPSRRRLITFLAHKAIAE